MASEANTDCMVMFAAPRCGEWTPLVATGWLLWNITRVWHLDSQCVLHCSHPRNQAIKWPTCAGDRSQLRKRGLKTHPEKNLTDRPFRIRQFSTWYGNFSENADGSAEFGKCRSPVATPVATGSKIGL